MTWRFQLTRAHATSLDAILSVLRDCDRALSTSGRIFANYNSGDTQGPPPQRPIGKLLDAHYDGASFPAAPAAGAIAAARAEPQNRQRVLLRYMRRVSRCCTFQRQEGQSGAEGGASPPL